jgi:gluconolactonase
VSAGARFRRPLARAALVFLVLAAGAGCGLPSDVGGGASDGAGLAPARDASTDASLQDTGGTDAGRAIIAPSPDAGIADTGDSDAGGADAGRADAGGADAGGADGGVADASAPAGFCPAGVFSPPKLSGITLARVDSIPIRDGFAQGWSNVEGPAWIGDALFVSQFGSGATPASRIVRVDASGKATVAIGNAGTNGVALGRDGRLYGASHVVGGIVAFDLAHLDAAPKTVVASYGGARFDSPNDLAVRSDGTIYFTDPNYQAPEARPQRASRVYRVLPDRTVEIIDATLSQPNGIALSLDERTLWVGGEGGLFRFPLAPDGSVSGPRATVTAISGAVDGLGRDCAGDLYVAGSDRVVVLDPNERVLGTLKVTGSTNVAFGGADRRTLYVTAQGNPPALWSAKLDVPGLPD